MTETSTVPGGTESTSASLASRLSAFVAGTTVDRIPSDVLAYAKVLMLDTLACMVGGTAIRDRHETFVSVAGLSSTAPEATVVGTGERLGVIEAAAVNAEAGATLSAQDSFFFSHTANLTLATALAVCEQRESSGADLLASFVAGFEATSVCDLLLPSSLPRLEASPQETRAGMRRPFMTVGAAAAAARALGLDPGCTAHALAVAAASAPGDAGVHYRLSSMNYYSYFDKARAGLTAAALAARGFTGHPENLLELLTPTPAPSGELEVDGRRLVEEIGSFWWLQETCIKAHPICRYLSAAVEAFADARAREGWTPDEVDHVVVLLSPTAASLPMIAAASANRGRTGPDAALNAVFDVGLHLALVAHDVPSGPEWYQPRRLADPDLLAFAEKVSLEVDVELGRSLRGDVRRDRHHRIARTGGGGIEVHARGAIHRLSRVDVRGDPWSSLTRADLDLVTEKFRRYAQGVLDETQVDRVIGLVREMEKVDSVAELVTELRPDPQAGP